MGLHSIAIPLNLGNPPDLNLRAGLPGQEPPLQFYDVKKDMMNRTHGASSKSPRDGTHCLLGLLAPRSWRHHRREAFRALDSLVGHPEIGSLYQCSALITLNQPTTTAARDGGI
jgi:hypothetical protein